MSGSRVILPFGERALLVELSSLDEVLALHARLAGTRPDGIVELVPAARTVFVQLDPQRVSMAAARAWIAASADHSPPPARDGGIIEVPVHYDGADLIEVADALGLSPEALVAQHHSCTWTVAFTGFAPGFAYLVSAQWPHDVPRRSTPRTRVPSGAVGLAGEFSGAYPRSSPGGWQLIGTTPAPLFDEDATPSALLSPGARVRYVPVPSQVSLRATPSPSSSGALAPGRRGLRIVEPGPLATVQDQGRPHHAAEGVARSGAADRGALRAANRLLGNDDDAAGIEITMGGFEALATVDLWVVVTGAWGDIWIDGRAVDPYSAQRVPRGTSLRLAHPARGVRSYLAVRGGIAAHTAVGSRSSDTMSLLGPAPLQQGDIVAVGEEPTQSIPVAPPFTWSAAPRGQSLEIGLALGPRADWFTDAEALFRQRWTVSARADRVGIRLDGTPLVRAEHRELPSEGMLPGAIQVPPDGLPVILGPDGPVTGGYPVIAVVADASLDALAQARPGTALRFRRVH